jgi:hypothetical protein
MSDTQVLEQPKSPYVEFWNNILVPKIRALETHPGGRIDPAQ